MMPFTNQAVAAAFDAYPPEARSRLMSLRELVFKTAAATDGVGELEEALKWGEPAYLTSKTKSGSTIRIAWKKSAPTQYAMYFNCQTDLVETFRTLFPSDFRFEGNRAIAFDTDARVPTASLVFCIAAALTYHLRKAETATRPRAGGMR
jgi:hypothetical protein